MDRRSKKLGINVSKRILKASTSVEDNNKEKTTAEQGYELMDKIQDNQADSRLPPLGKLAIQTESNEVIKFETEKDASKNMSEMFERQIESSFELAHTPN